MTIRKVKNYFNALKHPFFSYVKIVTKGYLTPATYATIYKYSLQSPEGYAVDIGPAQGGTSIAIAKGLIRKKAKNQWKVYSIEKGHSSNALFERNDVNENKSILQKNIERFGVDDVVEVIMKFSDEAFSSEAVPSPISVLSIDADGALDRDFGIFYNHLVPGAVVILDDYEDKINKHAERLLTGSEEDIEKHKTDHRAQTLADGTPLGKEILTYRFVNYLKTNGFIEQKEIEGGNTWFGIKPATAPELTDRHLAEMRKIRKEIEEEFWQRRAEIQNT